MLFLSKDGSTIQPIMIFCIWYLYWKRFSMLQMFELYLHYVWAKQRRHRMGWESGVKHLRYYLLNFGATQ